MKTIEPSEFFFSLFEFCDTGSIDFRTLIPNGEQVIARDEFWPWAKLPELPSLNGQGNHHFAVALRDGGGRKEDITQTPAVWVDMDLKNGLTAEEAGRRLKGCPLPVSAIVASGGGFHVYWFLKEPCGKEEIPQLESYLRRLAVYFDSDRTATDASRILRVPGTLNLKYHPSRRVKLTHLDPSRRYDLSDFDSWLPEDYKQSTPEGPRNPLGWQNAAVEGVGEGGRHRTALQLAGRYVQKGLSDAEIASFLVSWNAGNNPPKQSLCDPNSQEIRDIISYAREKQGRNVQADDGGCQQLPARSSQGSPSMADLKEYLDIALAPGEFFTSEAACRGIGAFNREHKKAVYVYLSRLVQSGALKRDPYKHGGFRRPLEIFAYDTSGAVEVCRTLDIELPLEVQNIIKCLRNQLIAIAGRFDTGKSSLLWHTAGLNYEKHRVVIFSSAEWDLDAIKERMDALGIPRPHPNVTCYPMLEGYEDLIPPEPCIVLVDYIRTNDSPYEIDRQFYRILQNLRGGIAIAAIQKHPGLDRPTGGQFAVHAPHHVLLLDKLVDREGAYIVKVLKTKGERDREGLFRVFKFEGEGRRLKPIMDTWKRGEIRFDRPQDNKDNKDNK